MIGEDLPVLIAERPRRSLDPETTVKDGNRPACLPDLGQGSGSYLDDLHSVPFVWVLGNLRC